MTNRYLAGGDSVSIDGSVVVGMSGATGYTPADGSNMSRYSLPTINSPILLAPDGSGDRARSVGDTAGVGLGVLATSPRTPGASEVKAKYDETGSTSTTAEQILDPTSGKLIRIVSISYFTDSATAHSLEVYFGVGDTGGANVSTNATRAILVSKHDAGAQESERGFWSWPDGAGPVAVAANDGLFIRTDADIGAAGHVVVHYREE